MDGLNRIKEICKFDNDYDCYVLLAVARKKYNPLTNSQEVVFREVIKSEKDIERRYNQIIATAKNYISPEGNKYNYYIYLTANPRNSLKAMFALQNKMNHWTYEALHGTDISKRLKKLGGYWISELMKPENKSGRGLFLLDVDTKDELALNSILEYLSQINCNYQYFETRNGYHILTDPFNPVEFKSDDVELKKDALLFIEFIED